MVMLVDEMQCLGESDLAALIMALHRVGQKQLPIVLIGAGLPQLVGIAGRARSYAERLFLYPPVGALTEAEAIKAIQSPLKLANCELTEPAMQKLFNLTQG